MVPVGLLWYGWSARSSIHWIMPWVLIYLWHYTYHGRSSILMHDTRLQDFTHKNPKSKMLLNADFHWQEHRHSHFWGRYRSRNTFRHGIHHWYISKVRSKRHGGHNRLEKHCSFYFASSCPFFVSFLLPAAFSLRRASSAFIRQVTIYVSSLMHPTRYSNLGFGWGNTLIALIAIFIGIPAPILLRYDGPALRKRSQYAMDN